MSIVTEGGWQSEVTEAPAFSWKNKTEGPGTLESTGEVMESEEPGKASV